MVIRNGKKKTIKRLYKTAHCMFHVNDGAEVTSFATDMRILDLLRESDTSAGINGFVKGKYAVVLELNCFTMKVLFQ
jgi:hypothetical protein